MILVILVVTPCFVAAVEKAAQFLSVNTEQLVESLTHNKREMRGKNLIVIPNGVGIFGND